ncbi:MAG: 2-hydroxyacid dehydrogenase [Spirochaetia bacterium]|jgi:phosphoglycerate dehydrogenase-like enzyme|nr:2-hydroxyacid dehydrogenase [Spirochaetia bacterium]
MNQNNKVIMKILIQMNIDSLMESKIDELKKAHKNLEVFTDTDSAPLSEIDIIAGGLLTEKLIQKSSSLKMIFVPFVGVNHLPLELLKERGIRICNSHGNDRFVAEKVLALLLAFHGRIVEFHKALENEIWHGFWAGGGAEDTWESLYRKKVTILGTGAIGRQTAKMLSIFDADVTGYKKHQVKEVIPEGFRRIASNLEDAVKGAEILIVAVPLTDETRGMVNQDIMNLMKGGVILNIARGPVVDEKALYNSLTNGTLKGACIDVWYNYPDPGSKIKAPGNYPFHKLPNVVLSPHVGGGTRAAFRRDIDLTFANISSYISGGEVQNEIDINAGY